MLYPMIRTNERLKELAKTKQNLLMDYEKAEKHEILQYCTKLNTCVSMTTVVQKLFQNMHRVHGQEGAH